MPIFASLLCGFVFGCGLTISGMIQPAKVLGFLDLFGIPSGAWDPSLVVVMAAALAVASIGYALLGSRTPLFEKESLWRCASIRPRLGTGWTLSRTGDRRPIDAIGSGDRFRDSDGNRHARPRPLVVARHCSRSARNSWCQRRGWLDLSEDQLRLMFGSAAVRSRRAERRAQARATVPASLSAVLDASMMIVASCSESWRLSVSQRLSGRPESVR